MNRMAALSARPWVGQPSNNCREQTILGIPEATANEPGVGAAYIVFMQKHINILVPLELWERLLLRSHSLSQAEGRSVTLSEVVRRACEQFIQDGGENGESLDQQTS